MRDLFLQFFFESVLFLNHRIQERTFGKCRPEFIKNRLRHIQIPVYCTGQIFNLKNSRFREVMVFFDYC